MIELNQNIVKNIFDISNYELDRPLPKGRNKKIIGLIKHELDGEVMAEFAALRPKTYSYLTDDSDENKKAKCTKRVSCEKQLEFEDYKHCLEPTQRENKINQLEKYKVKRDSICENLKEFIKSNRLIIKSQQRFRSQKLHVFTEEVDKIALSANDDKRIQLIELGTNAYGTNGENIYKKEEFKCINIIKQYEK